MKKTIRKPIKRKYSKNKRYKKKPIKVKKKYSKRKPTKKKSSKRKYTKRSKSKKKVKRVLFQLKLDAFENDSKKILKGGVVPIKPHLFIKTQEEDSGIRREGPYKTGDMVNIELKNGFIYNSVKMINISIVTSNREMTKLIPVDIDFENYNQYRSPSPDELGRSLNISDNMDQIINININDIKKIEEI